MVLNQVEMKELLKKVNNRMLYLTNDSIEETCPISNIDFNKWEWPQGVGLYGMWKYYKATGNDTYLKYIEDWYQQRIAEGLPEKNVNTMAPMLTLACMAQETDNKCQLELCNEWAQWIMEEMPRTEEQGIQHIVSGREHYQQMWDDTLFMTVLFLAKVGEIMNNEAYKSEAEYQFLLHIKYLQDRETGLWYHGWCFEGRHNFAKAFWARGNCWITAGIPEYLEISKSPESIKRYLIGILRNQVNKLAELQNEDGMWHTLLDDASSYVEASATAGFAYGILKGINMKILPEKYLRIAEKAVNAVIGVIGADGTVGQVSYGTGMGADLQYYRDIPLCPMAYGQSLTVMMLREAILYRQ